MSLWVHLKNTHMSILAVQPVMESYCRRFPNPNEYILVCTDWSSPLVYQDPDRFRQGQHRDAMLSEVLHINTQYLLTKGVKKVTITFLWKQLIKIISTINEV